MKSFTFVMLLVALSAACLASPQLGVGEPAAVGDGGRGPHPGVVEMSRPYIASHLSQGRVYFGEPEYVLVR